MFGLELDRLVADDLPLLAAATLAFMAIGLLAGAVSKSEEAAIGIANFVVLPMAFLSGSSSRSTVRPATSPRSARSCR